MLFLGKNFAGATFKKGENIDQFLLDYCNKTLTEITTPADCDIRDYFFRNQNQLQSVTFGEGCTTLNAGVCLDCSSLRNVYIPNSVTTIESDAFSGCSNVHFIIDNSSSNLRGYPWGASSCSVEWLQGGGATDGDFILFNDYSTMEQSSRQGNGWHGFVFIPSITPCDNPESLEMLYQGRYVTGIDFMCNPYARQGEAQQPVYVEVYDDYGYGQLTRSINSDIIRNGNFDEFVHFDFEHPINIDPNSKYEIAFRNSNGRINQVSPATFNMYEMDPNCGCYWSSKYSITSTEMVAFKLIFE